MRRVFIILCALLSIGLVCDAQFYQTSLDVPTQPEEEIEFVLVIDKSGSMRGERLAEARNAAGQFIDQLTQGQYAAVIAFDENAEVMHEMSNDKSVLHRAVQDITPGFWTAYVPALQTAQQLFSPNAKKYVVFLSDGVDEEPPRVFSALQELLDEDICVYSVAYAAEEGADSLLGGMADLSLDNVGCGRFFEAKENGFDLEYVFTSLHREASGREVLDVDVAVNSQRTTTIDVTARYEQQPLSSACFSPLTTLTLWDSTGIVYHEQAPQERFSIPLTPGTYEYEAAVAEQCQGTCYVHGATTGRFTVLQDNTCTFTEQDFFTLFTPDIVRITPNGFIPRTLGTSGTVVWQNTDAVPRQVVSAQGTWESPLIAPGDNWSKTFTEGLHGYTDEEGSFTGTVRNSQTTEPSQFVFVFDNSGSMSGAPLNAAKNAASAFVELLSPQDRASFIVFDQRVRLLQGSTTTDKARLLSLIQEIHAEGFSLYIPALQLAGEQLQQQSIARKPVVIFLSDGLPRDPQGLPGILDAIDTYLPGACMHVIAYLTDNYEAQTLLEAMAEHAHAQTNCGALYTVAGDGDELRAVLGEIYVGAQEHLAFRNVSVQRIAPQTFNVSARVVSKETGQPLPLIGEACLPPATVRVIDGVHEYPLTHNNGVYSGVVQFSEPVQTATLAARITADDSARTATAQLTFPIPKRLPYEWLALVIVGVLLVLYSIIRKH